MRKNRKCFFLKRSEGSSMLLSVIFAVLILVVISFLIQITEYESSQNYSLEEFLKMKNLTFEQLNIALFSEQSDNGSSGLLGYIPEDWSSKLTKTYWGGYNIINSSVRSSRDSMQMVALVGSHSGNEALVLKVIPNRINLSEYVTIRGECNFPLSLLNTVPKSANSNYERSREGNSINSTALWDATLDAELLNFGMTCRQLCDDFYLVSNEMIISESSNTFFDKTMVYKSPDTLRSRSLKGNIVLTSPGKIFIESTCTLSGVWIIADEIELGSGFIGDVHLMAKKSVELDSAVSLLYPSSIAIIGDENLKSKLIMHSNSIFEGVVYGVNLNRNSTLAMGPETHFTGEIYWLAKADLKGKIEGSCFVNSLFSASTSSYTDNALHEVSIIPRNKSAFFLSSRITKPSAENRFIIKWLE